MPVDTDTDPKAEDALPLDPAAVRDFLGAWVAHEHWFQTGRPARDTYSWPIPGTRAIAAEGSAAYFAYRDWLAGVALAVEGYDAMLADLWTLVADLAHRSPTQPRELLLTSAAQDTAFHGQWNNVFASGFTWEGVTHESLAAYARKYEVEWPLRVLTCLAELIAAGACDPSLARFRNKQGRLQKGKLVEVAREGFAHYQALHAVVRLAYEPRLRHVIAHNEYVITDTGIRSLDGAYTATAADVWAHVRALAAVQAALLRLESTAKHDPASLAPRGVLAVGWARCTTASLPSAPEVIVLQLAAFRQYDPGAFWLDHGTIDIGTGAVETRLGTAAAQRGPLVDDLHPVLDALRAGAPLTCHVVGVVPCLHGSNPRHRVHELPEGRYCEFGAPVTRTVSVHVTGHPDSHR